MRVLRVSGINVAVTNEPFCGDEAQALPPACELVLCGYRALAEADLAREITGESACIAQVAELSAKVEPAVFCGVKTNIGGVKHLSAAVAANGRLLDIVDRTSNVRGDEYRNGNKIKVYRTQSVQAALLLDTDVLLQKNWARICNLCDCVICLSLELSDEHAAQVAALSAAYGLPYVLVADNGIWWGE